MRLLLVRHGECVKTFASAIGGRHLSSPLTPHGRQQAAALGRWWRRQEFKPDFVYVSPAKRTAETARIINRYARFRGGASSMLTGLEEREELVEVGQGDWEGRDRLDIYTDEVLQEMEKLGWDFKAPNGESMREGEQRLAAFVDGLLREHARLKCVGNGLTTEDNSPVIKKMPSGVVRRSTEDDSAIIPCPRVQLVGGPTILLVTHALLAKCLMRYLLGVKHTGLTWRHGLRETGVCEFTFANDGWALERWNDTAHLARYSLEHDGSQSTDSNEED